MPALNPLDHYSEKKIESWFGSGKRSNDSFDKLIYFWISFNAFYEVTFPNKDRRINSRGYDRTPAHEKFGSLLNVVKSEAKQILEKHRNDIKVLIDPKKVTDMPARKYQRRYRTNINQDPSKALKNIVQIVYRIRNKLFHGGKTYGTPSSIKVLNACNNILHTILAKCLALYHRKS